MTTSSPETYKEQDSSLGSYLEDLVDVGEFIAKDAGEDIQGLLKRDHEIGLALPQTESLKDSTKIRHWVDVRRRQSEQEDEPSVGERIAGGHATASVLMAFIGIILGWGAAASLLRYDGSQPVNVTWLLLIFVVAQIFLVALYLIALLPRRLSRSLPFLDLVPKIIESYSPARLLLLLGRVLPARLNLAIQRLVGQSRRQHERYGSVARWVVFGIGQVFSLAFVVGSILGTVALVVFTDLAFGWSTTLDVDNNAFYKFVSTLAWPWSKIVTSAVPTLELVEATRYFRIDPNIASSAGESVATNAATLGQWWPFVVTAMVVYGLIPRLITLFLSRRRLRNEIEQSLVDESGVADVLDRLSARRVSTQASEPETPTHDLTHHKLESVDSRLLAGEACVVNWSEVPLDDEALREHVKDVLRIRIQKVYTAGGTRTVKEDLDVVAEVAQMQPIPTVVIVVKSWETPMLEFLDFIKDTRHAIGKGTTIVILAVAAKDNRVTVAKTQHEQIWSERLQTIGDPNLRFGPPGYQA